MADDLWEVGAGGGPASTIWERTTQEWKIVYHQGTVVQDVKE
jgi:hypothetical protein